MKKFFLFFLLLLAALPDTHAQITAIPDTSFESKLVTLGIDSDGLVNGQISSADARAVTRLDITSSNITSLIGIDSFINLTELHCSANQITVLDVSNLKSLTRLFCHDNLIDSLNVTGLTNLTALICHDNQLKSIDISSNINLFRVECHDNQITNFITNGGFAALGWVMCGNNQLTSVDISNSPNVGLLDCSDNQLTTLDLTNNAFLQSLNVSNNQLTAIDLSNSSGLKSVVLSSNNLSELDFTASTILERLSVGNNQLSKLILNSSNQSSMHAINNLPDLLICVKDLRLISASRWMKDSNAYYSTSCYPLAVEGHVAVDTNQNCLVDSVEFGLIGMKVIFSNNVDTFQVICDQHTGYYRAYIDTGSYSVSLSSPYWQSCIAQPPLVVDTNYVVQTINIPLTPTVFCPFLEVNIGAPFLRMAGGGSAYTISYCNTGTVVANNAYVEVNLDPSLNVVNTSLPIATQNNNLYRFNVGNIGIGACGSFSIQVVVDTSSQIAQTHCTHVQIYPDSLCLPSFNVPVVDGSVSCQMDTVYFQLENKGTNMLQPQNYQIYEDSVIILTGTIQLNSGQSAAIIQPALEGKTYRLEVEQAPNYPAILGNPIFSLAIEGCHPKPDGSFNVGFITQFSNELSQPAQAIDCQQNIAAYDPNDKAAQPVGYGNAHYIYANTAIDYKVRFQNTGTDTAFNIFILDTLSSYVDPATLQMGASSHSYNWSILSGNVLRVDFPNIMLVDSNANEPLSHGFFRYRIEQQPNNALGSVIYNQAAIYFDYNPPIFTNTTFHTIGEDFVTKLSVSVEKILKAELEVLVYPNPFEVSTTIAVEGGEFDELELQVFDLLGRQVAYEQMFSTHQIELTKGNLQTGMYVYRLIGDNKLISTGKVSVE